ncbi:MAG: tagaturonate epimerase family protein [Sphaerochaetaceae bacterium]|nr:tagaturonate epimerase family protein [Sphaerochaetaceae bacterium]
MVKNFKTTDGREFAVYEDSLHDNLFMVDSGDCDYLVADPALGFIGERVTCAECGKKRVLAPLNHHSANVLRKAYPWTAPQRVLGRDKTIGVGDRLGIAGDGHIRVFRRFPDVTPVLAQQSIRELNLTNRTFHDVIDSASFTVFRCGYTNGFGADGDHVKTAREVSYALKSGATMITLDCSEQIDNSIDALSKEEVDARYESVRDRVLERYYMNRSFDIGEGISISFDEELFKRTVLIYSKAVAHAVRIYNTLIVRNARQLADFEVSIDETLTPTLPAQHFFVANELAKHYVNIATVAPRFCGEFQKGIDYIGDLEQFEQEMKVHAAIARKFGYKLSIHSGSDKFSIFSCAGKETRGRFHLKTAGTNWLEAMKLVAMKDPSLYREIHRYALDGAFEEARKYYHVTTDLTKIPDLDSLSDSELPDLFKNNDSRQLIHITYGLILNEKNPDGSFKFRDRLYKLWRENKEGYARLIDMHIGRHASSICCD